jgi:acyl-homoserine lactone acylase PvdQ
LLCLFSATALGQQQSIQIKGIKDKITIYRDERGIPYIEAKNDEDLYFAQGYATATDRLWQMDLFRRTVRGELAEVLTAGPGNFALDQDKLHRTYGFTHAHSFGSVRSRRQRLRRFTRSEVDAAGVSDSAIQFSTLDANRFTRSH